MYDKFSIIDVKIYEWSPARVKWLAMLAMMAQFFIMVALITATITETVKWVW